ncbi:ATP-dependent Lon protease [Candidatus Thermokryptus mobilis]|uniref:endopeptidase La n=1 Tax=Candidatus Thermokryptus mobilis TaxID=1643428 RepID=A0A0S4MPK5_9BACT|nr:AAA family ATPase [Candidatus Thermokryptus mobilis]CUU00645.1 ATP-dependent Lon protease [Candidatus Thermokryptus mobilis]
MERLKYKHKFKELNPDELKWSCPVEKLQFETTDEIEPLEDIIGQDRALKALKLGTELFAPGYNVFVCGLTGTGRMTTIKHILKQISPKAPQAPDRCYVYNFKNPDEPRLLEFPRGQAIMFKRNMEAMIFYLKQKIPRTLEDEKYVDARNKVIEKYQRKEQELLREFQKKVEKERFAIINMQVENVIKPSIVPIVEGKPVPIEQLVNLAKSGKISEEEVKAIERKYLELQAQMQEIFKKEMILARELSRELEELEREAVRSIVDGIIDEIKEQFKIPKVHEYLDDVRKHILNNLHIFKATAEQVKSVPFSPEQKEEVDPFLPYRVNVILDNSEQEGVPVIIETTPTFSNIFGTIEKVYDSRGFWRTDFTKIKAGSILKADGGYLVLNARDALSEPGVWKALKRTLMYRKLEIQPMDVFFQISSISLKPEPIEINTKIIMLGDPELYHLLYEYDEDFQKIFKIKADFDFEMDLNDEAIIQYAKFIRKICRDENLRPFEREAIGKVVEFAVRQAGRRDKITTRFSTIADLIREADYWARVDGSNQVKPSHVQKAIQESFERRKMIEDKIKEMISKGVILVDVTGERVGQVNGLTIYEIGDYRFGRPVRITASVSMGRAGIINIERESNLSGRIHDKGVLILAGYLREKYAQDKPLTLSASICFEQSYSGIDGDSASSTELYALLSALSGLPIKQGIAVTGSVNQKGDIQPIGGVNEKIEGFFDVCKAKGLTGEQGVIIPKKNVDDLMLRDDVVEAVKKGLFHIYPVETIDEGIEILTGVKAGKRLKDGKFEPGTVNYLVDKRLREISKGLKKFTSD